MMPETMLTAQGTAAWATISPATEAYATRAAAFAVVQAIYAWSADDVGHVLSVIDSADPDDEYTLYRLQGEIIASAPDERLLFHTSNLRRFAPDVTIADLVEPSALPLYQRAS